MDLGCSLKSRIRTHWGLVLFLIHITYYENVFKWLSGSFSIGCGSIEPVACPITFLPTVPNGEGRNGSQVFISNFCDVIASWDSFIIHLCHETGGMFCKCTYVVCIVFSGVWNFIQDNFTNKTQAVSMHFNSCWVNQLLG